MRVNDFVGIPYGRLDCGRLVIDVLAGFGIELKDPGLAAARSIKEGNGIMRFVPEHWEAVELDELQPMDLLFSKPGKMEYHVCMVGEDGWALTTTGITGSRLVPLGTVLPKVLSARRPQ